MTVMLGAARTYFVLGCTALVLLVVGSIDVAAAEDSPSPSAGASQGSESGYQLEEIIVTAEKRETRLQDTPISLTAITGAELEAQGLESATDFARGVPGVALSSAGPGQTDYTIRGLPSSGASVAPVGFYLDDAPIMATPSQNGHVGVDPDLYDLNRVEVLRGPQGTLYGAGSMGGTVKLVTNQPDLHAFSASAKLDGSGTDGGGFNGGADGMLNLPLIDGTLAVRLVGTYEHTSGWIDRIVLDDFPLPTNSNSTRGNVLAAPVAKDYRDVNDVDLSGGRLAVRYQAADHFSLTGTLFYQRIAQDDGLGYFDNPPGTQAHYQPFDVPESFSDTFHFYNLVADYELPTFSITSVTSYWNRTQGQTQDISETLQSAFGLPAFDGADGGVGPAGITEIDDTNQFSEELRVTSTGQTRLQWLVGAFYADFNWTQNQFSLADGYVPLFGSNNLFTGIFKNNLKQKALFANVSYNLTDRLKATVGLRGYSYTQNGSTTVSGIVEPSLTPTTTYVYAKNSGTNPAFTLSYDVVGNFMVYGTAAKGFRPGAGNAPVPTSGADSCLPALEAIGRTSAPTQYDPDTVWSFEVGEKASFADRRFTVNTSVYHEQWKNIQQSVSLNCGFGFIGNVGTASVWGGETELNWRVTPNWTLAQSAGYTHAVLSETSPGTGLVAGSKLLNVPDYNAYTSVVFSYPVARYTLVARASNVLVGSSEDLTFTTNKLPGYDIANFRTGVVAGRWSAFVYVDNLTDKQAFLSNTHNYALNIPSLNRVSTNQPRTIGLTFEFHY